MPIYDLFGDTSGLPHTKRGNIPYEIEALTPREVWGHGHGTTTLVCRQTWNRSSTWIRAMLGEWEVRSRSTAEGARIPQFVRHIPEPLRYNDAGDGTDTRVQWCTGMSQTEQGGNPADDASANPLASEERFAQEVTNWPATLWCKYQATFETTPYVVRTNDEIIDLRAEWAGVDVPEDAEFLRYVVRNKRVYNKEQPIPAATNAGGFKIVDDAVAGNRKAIGQVASKIIELADVHYKWCAIPLNWPPYPGWTIPAPPRRPWPAKNLVSVPRLRDAYIGRINSDYFDYTDPEGYNWGPGTLLYLGFEEFAYYNASGQRTADVTYHFKYKEGGWQYVMDAFGEWRLVTADVVRGDNKAGTSAGRTLYETADFRNLFTYVSA
jgi:hypothetical protein